MAEKPATSLPYVLARAELEAQSGKRSHAISALHDVLRRHWSELMVDRNLFASAMCVAIAGLDFDTAAAMMNRRCDTDDWFSLGVEESRHRHADVVRWEVERTRSGVWLARALLGSAHIEATIVRLAGALPLFAAYRSHEMFAAGSLFVNLGDVGFVPGLAFCDYRPEYFLVPDAIFILHQGYADMRADRVPWSQRRAMGYWRGGTSGRPTDPALGWRSLPRTILCEISRKHPDILDAGITHVVQLPPASEHEIRNAGITRVLVPATEFRKFKYQIDIDGNTSSWPGLFQKLLTGSPVLKVASAFGYRQWYYDCLRPWCNFVPVSGDMSDLIDKISWLQRHDDAARQIGENGLALAMSLSYETELRTAGRTIAAAMRYFSNKPEVEIQFGVKIPASLKLVSGWTVPCEDGLLTVGYESRLELERPIAAESYVLTLDVAPFTNAPAPPAQRITLVVNGEILREAVLSTRRLVSCRVPRRTIESADQLIITLLHPNAASLASASCPLDDRVLSLVVHSLTLTAASVHARTDNTGAEMLPPDPISPTGEKVENRLYGPDIWLPSDARFSRLRTHWGTVVFADTDRNMLRHGPAEMSPANLMLGENEGTAYLFHIGPDGTRFTVRFLPEPQEPRNEKLSETARYQSFRVLQTAANDVADFGLASDGLLLCAEGDGRVTLSRRALGPWERFQLADP